MVYFYLREEIVESQKNKICAYVEQKEMSINAIIYTIPFENF